MYGYGEVRAMCTACNLFPVHYPHSVEVTANQTIYNSYLIIIAYKINGFAEFVYGAATGVVTCDSLKATCNGD